MTRSPLLVLALALALLAGACTGSPAAEPSPSASPSPVPTAAPGALAELACSLPPEQLLRIWRGSPSDRVGDVLIVPEEPNFVDGGISHAGPWEYVQRVPFLLYGPGRIAPAGSIDRPITLADVAPTFAELLGFDFRAPDGRTLTEALVPAAERPDPPRLIITVVWDAGGRVVLDAWPEAWPVLRGLIPQGAWYDDATVGSSPSVTPPIHTTMGTGAFPVHHKVTDNQIRIGGVLQEAWARGPASMVVPTLADLYDAAMGNRPLVGGIATLSWHLGMIGHGAMWAGGDRDLAIVRQKAGDEGAEADAWNLPAALQSWFEFPEYANDFPPLADYFDETDRLDGVVDGLWRGHEFTREDLRGGFHTPARVPYETRLIEEVIVREGFGADEVPDLLFTNYKVIDEVGHEFTLNSPEMQDTLLEQDRYLGELIDFLNERVGEGEWVLLVTADHGHTPDPDLTGAFRISVAKMEENLQATFDLDGDDTPVVLKVRPTQIYLDTAELAENGFTVDQVAQYLNDYTKIEAVKSNLNVEPGEEQERVFAAAFPTAILDDLPCLPPEAGG